jgi:hypothetical protein
MFRSSDRILWQVPWLIPADDAVTSSACTDIATLDLELSSDHSWPTGMLIILRTVSTPCKAFVPLKHSTMTQGFFVVQLLDHRKTFFTGFANFWYVYPLLKL